MKAWVVSIAVITNEVLEWNLVITSKLQILFKIKALL